MMFCFGFSTLMVVAVQNFGGLMACRWFLGMVCPFTFPPPPFELVSDESLKGDFPLGRTFFFLLILILGSSTLSRLKVHFSLWSYTIRLVGVFVHACISKHLSTSPFLLCIYQRRCFCCCHCLLTHPHPPPTQCFIDEENSLDDWHCFTPLLRSQTPSVDFWHSVSFTSTPARSPTGGTSSSSRELVACCSPSSPSGSCLTTRRRRPF